MKKQIIPCILLAVLAGCTNESELTGGSDYVSRVTITAKDFVAGDAATRTAFEVSASGLTFKWAATDVVGIYPNEGDQVSFPMTAGAGTNSASFDGGGWALKGNYTYAAYFPYSVDNTTQGRTYTALPITYTGQTQSANNSTADMGDYDYMVAKASTPASGNVNFAFEHVGSVLYVQLVSPVAETFTRLTLSTEDALWTTDATMNIATGALTSTNTATELSVDLANISVSANGTLYVWLIRRYSRGRHVGQDHHGQCRGQHGHIHRRDCWQESLGRQGISAEGHALGSRHGRHRPRHRLG